MIMTKDSHGNYVKIEDIKQQDSFNGISPIDFKSNGDNLKNYRIYGNTVNGEGVGDRTANLFDGEWTQGGVYNSGDIHNENQLRIKTIIPVMPSQTYTIRTNLLIRMIYAYNNTTLASGRISNLLDASDGVESAVITIPTNANLIAISLKKSDNSNVTPSNVEWTMLNFGSQPLPYEPYGYRVPVMVTNGTDTETTNLYLPEQIKMVGDETEYIDFGEQKQHFADGTSADVALPALPTLSGTNTLSVNTNIKPSKVWGGLNDPKDILYVKDKLGNILFSKYYEIEDEPPLTYKAKKAGALKDYRIYGNTVDGESVGDRTGNLFDGSWENKFIDTYGNTGYSTDMVLSSYVTVIPNQTYSVKSNMHIRSVHSYNGTTHTQALIDNVAGLDGATFTIPADSNSIRISLKKANDSTITPDDVEWCMLNTGSEALPYEPYGYKVPVIIRGINLFDESVVVDKKANTEHSNYQIYHQGGILYINGTTTSTQADTEIANMSSINSEMLEYINQNYGKYVFTSISPGTIQIRYSISGSGNYYISNSYTSTSSRSANRFVFRMKKDYQYDHEPIGILIKKEQIQSVYEPYHAPTTTTLYLPEQIKKVGDEAEYIDFMEQKQHFANGASADVTLPALPTFSGTNMLSVGTEVQPSDIYLKGKIEKKPKIYYYSQDGQTLLYTESVLKGSNGIYSGTPTKMADPQYTYTFAGWSSSTGQTAATPEVRNNIQNDKNVYAAFSQTLNTYTVYFYNESDTPIEIVQNVPYGGTATYTGATPTSSQTGYIFSGWSPSNTNITADTSCYAQFVDEDMYESISDTWSEIIANVSNGTYSTKYHIGDTKKIDLGTEGEVIMTIVGIDADDLADNSGKAPITWISKQLLKTDRRMNPSYQSGTEGTGTIGGWEKTEMRSYLKETVKPLIPEIVRNAIKPVKKYTRIYDVSETAVNDVVTADDVWIPSYKEVFGTGLETLGPTYSTAFPDDPPDDASRIKRKAGGSAAWWWLRSAEGYSYFMIVYPDGSYYSSFASSSGGVALGFCLGAPTYTVTYYSQDGQTVLSTETVEEGHDCTYSTVPTKESDTDFDHTFTGWSTSTNSTTATAGATENIQQNTNLYAAFSKSFKTDTISDSWEEIIANCDNGTYASKYQIGDLKTIDVGTEGPVQMQIVAIDTDLLASDNTKKAPITWISKQLLKTSHRMHSTTSNYLSDWSNCEMRTYLKNTIYPLIPQEVRNNIKEVTKYTNKRTASTTWTTISSTEDIWLPSYREVSNNTAYCETSGVQYNSIFTDGTSRLKHKMGESNTYWWTRSASGDSDSNYSYHFARVYSDGYANYRGDSCTIARGVAIGFCT